MTSTSRITCIYMTRYGYVDIKKGYVPAIQTPGRALLSKQVSVVSMEILGQSASPCSTGSFPINSM
jgi:hypothetical protein